MKKKLIATMALGASLMVASPVFAYEVKQGDTMSKIARDNSMSLNQLAGINPQVKDLNLIHVGQTINTEGKTDVATEVYSANNSVSVNEKDLLARLVRAEAESEPYSGKVAVATVVLNRVANDSFPDTIHDVIYQQGQFSPVSNGQINKPADAESIRAVNEALSWDRSQGAGSLFFYNPSASTSNWLDSKTTTLVIGNHVFKK
ncbi:cell wall hydrolase [Priestia endophytica]|uniref:cell wall hydrolase n=1 Tax=Priestia endophytica TaxID=135735 RepID=UPI003D285BBF